MFQGRLKTTLLDSGPMVDADFDRAIREGRAMELLGELDRRLELDQSNLIFDHFVPWCYYRCGWSSAGAPPDPFQEWSGSGASYFSFIILTTYTSEPSYTEYNGSVNYYDPIHTMPGTVDSSAGAKRFVNDQIEAWDLSSAADGREQLTFRNRWLYLPSQAVSSNINSLDIYFNRDCTDVTAYAEDKSRSGRIRFKDSGGNPITINKSSNQVLLLEYNWSMISL